MLVVPRQQKRVVAFDDLLTVRSYTTVLGDNPSVTHGPPVSIGWDFTTEKTLTNTDHSSNVVVTSSDIDAIIDDDDDDDDDAIDHDAHNTAVDDVFGVDIDGVIDFRNNSVNSSCDSSSSRGSSYYCHARRIRSRDVTRRHSCKWYLDAPARIERLRSNGVSEEDIHTTVASVRELRKHRRANSVRTTVSLSVSVAAMVSSSSKSEFESESEGSSRNTTTTTRCCAGNATANNATWTSRGGLLTWATTPQRGSRNRHQQLEKQKQKKCQQNEISTHSKLCLIYRYAKTNPLPNNKLPSSQSQSQSQSQSASECASQ